MLQSRHLLFALGLAALALPVRAEIYKYYDADGNLVLSDAVPKDRAERVERITPREIMTVPALKPQPRPASAVHKAVASPVKAGYAIVVQSPAQGASYARGPEPVPVAVSISPALAKAHRLEFLLDGGEPSASMAAIPVGDLGAGAHSLAIRVVDEKGAVLQVSTISFKVQ
ncbi:MAG: hypothetical protein K0S46_1485 [Moraxellaceae bacterium]|jgi:hypothetical protein|nr:hypothetical protein [Moraxellaceae bacterium]